MTKLIDYSILQELKGNEKEAQRIAQHVQALVDCLNLHQPGLTNAPESTLDAVRTLTEYVLVILPSPYEL